MRKIRTLAPFISLIFIVACHSDKSMRVLPASYSIEQLQNNLDVGGVAFNADESKILTFHNGTGIFNVYELNITDTSFKPLTHSTKESFLARDYVPGTSNFIYVSDQGGNENFHIFLQRAGDTSAKDLTPWPKSANRFHSWSHDKKSLYFTSNKRDPRFFDIWKMDTSDWKEKLFYKNDSAYEDLLISKTENWIAGDKPISTNKNVLYLINHKTNQRKQISNDNEANWTPQDFEANDSI
ncbi:MAG TPA: S9 family peptidase, partial [Puia sp.]|nr:S9 family peptidase [Puia sp.]